MSSLSEDNQSSDSNSSLELISDVPSKNPVIWRRKNTTKAIQNTVQEITFSQTHKLNDDRVSNHSIFHYACTNVFSYMGLVMHGICQPIRVLFFWILHFTGLQYFFNKDRKTIELNHSSAPVESPFSSSNLVLNNVGYNEFLQLVSRENKPAFCLIYDENCQRFNNFCRNVLFDETVTNILNEKFLFWACRLQSPDAITLCQAMGTRFSSSYCIILNVDNSSINIMSVLNASRVTKDVCIQKCFAVVDTIERHNQAELRKRLQIQRDRELQRLQDEEYERNLKRDQETRSRAEKIESQKRMTAEKKSRKIKMMESLRSDAITRIAERDILNVQTSSSNIKLALRFPNGQTSKHFYHRKISTSRDLIDDILASDHFEPLKSSLSLYSLRSTDQQAILSINFLSEELYVPTSLEEMNVDSQVLIVEVGSSEEDE